MEKPAVLSNCEPKDVFHYFEQISRIPRGSGNEKAVSDYIYGLAIKNNLRAVQDGLNNLVIYKEGSLGYEDRPPIILQGHLDMVCEKNKNTPHDFLTEPIKLFTNGDFIGAEGTTLGADNGIAVAYCLALMGDLTACHPPLEILLTTDEEAGMSGAESLDASLLSGRRMINLDTTHDDTFFAGCTGGVKSVLTLLAERDGEFNFSKYLWIGVRGLRGGHSGEEIDKERGNSLKLLARAMRAAGVGFESRVVRASGGMKVNAIPREAEALIAIGSAENEMILKKIETFRQTAINEYKISDPGLEIEYRTVDADSLACRDYNENGMLPLTWECGKRLLSALTLLPNG
ncbi:MAG: M20/M25/M40 family metallo-hydrolase, partial [Defluviitaleaceae bacterium]|nr:M20/M25/M40 family metallo-hydrolase [Defluviitaleaceae bacterium]